MKWRRWALALLPVAAGLVVASLWSSVLTLANPVVYLRADLATLAAVVGVVLSALAAAGVALWERAERQGGQQASDLRARMSEERRRFLRRLDHELKNPLTAIRAGLANAINGSTTAEQRDALSSVEAQVMRLSQLTGDLRKLAELETRPLEREDVDLDALLHEAVALAQEQPESYVRQVSLSLPQAPWPLSSVPGDWESVLVAR